MRTIQFTATILAISALFAGLAAAQLTAQDIDALRQQGEAEGWTFSVGENAATKKPLEALTGFKVTPETAALMPQPSPEQIAAAGAAKDALPAAFDWRTLGGVTTIKDQGSCGSCWAFSMLGALECAIKIHDGDEVDLSEQWLISCNKEGFGCSGSIFLFQYLMAEPDTCGMSGAVLEEYAPYMAYRTDCNCPYPRSYWINSFASAGGVSYIDLMKQAIMEHGPISVSIITNSAFHAYSGGVFNASAPGSIFDVTHAVVLVGWDDSLGTEGCWILRNSWGDDWGENGYMYIEYECSQVGAFATYVEYGDDLYVSHDITLDAVGEAGGPFTPDEQTYTLQNLGTAPLDWSVAADADWLTITPASGTLNSGASENVTVALNENAGSQVVGIYSAALSFTNATNGTVQPRMASLTVNQSEAYGEDLGTDPGWTAGTGWAYGQPTGQGSHAPDPTAGYTGPNVYGYNLNGDYENSMSASYLTTTAFDCSNLSGVTLSFRRWLGVERSYYDHATVEVSNDGASWTTVWENPNRDMEETFWTLCTYDISVVADHQATVYVRWGMGSSDSSDAYCGWNIDDIRLMGTRDGESAFSFTQTPVGATLMEGEPLSLSVEVSGAVGSVGYQWIKDGELIPGATFYTYEVAETTSDDQGWYSCRVWDESKGVRTTPSVFVRVYTEGELPATSLVGFVLAGLVCVVFARWAVRREG